MKPLTKEQTEILSWLEYRTHHFDPERHLKERAANWNQTRLKYKAIKKEKVA
jgi:hypothetical protein